MALMRLEQVPAGGADSQQVGDKILLSELIGLFVEHLAVADDGVERCSQLVAHVGQKIALGTVCCLGLLAGMLQLGDVMIHRVSSNLFPAHDHRDAQKFYIHERSILAATPGDGVN